MNHLTEPLLGALVDGDLGAHEVDAVVAHVAVCRQCRDQVLDARATRTLLLLARGGDLRPSPELTARLLAMGAPGAPFDGGAHPDLQPAHPLRRLRWLGAVTAGAAAVVGLYVLGGSLPPGPGPADILAAAVPVAQAAAPARGAIPVAATGGAGAASDRTATALAWLREQGWTVPVVVPATLEVVDVRQSSDGLLVMELAGRQTHVMVLQWRGRLDPALAAGVPLALGGGDAHLVSSSPWTAVKQSGSVVVAVVCHGPSRAGRQVMAAIPQAEPDMGPVARIGRGWDVLTASVAWDARG